MTVINRKVQERYYDRIQLVLHLKAEVEFIEERFYYRENKEDYNWLDELKEHGFNFYYSCFGEGPHEELKDEITTNLLAAERDGTEFFYLRQLDDFFGVAKTL
jgi:hypothetical protein